MPALSAVLPLALLPFLLTAVAAPPPPPHPPAPTTQPPTTPHPTALHPTTLRPTALHPTDLRPTALRRVDSGGTEAPGPPGDTPDPRPSEVTPAGRWAWPLAPRPVVVHGFWLGPAPWSPGHRGVDLGAVPGSTVRAPAAGTVRFAGSIAGRGVLTIDHGNGVLSSFEPVGAGPAPGTTVRRGEPVAALAPPPSGATHCSPQTCLHWGVRVNGRYVDPLTFLADHGPAVLLPMGRR